MNTVKKDIVSEGRRDMALKLYSKSRPIQGSVVEQYLSVHRGLHATNNADIKYCPSVYSKSSSKDVFTPALLAFTRKSNGEINHVQITKLDAKTANKSTVFKNCKQTFGRINGHAVNLNHTGEGDITFLTEGVETGLSILEVNPKARVLTVLGKENFAKINTEQLTKHVILCVDNDGKNTFKYQKNHTNNVLLAINSMEESGIKITINIPKNNDEDLNDILLNHGKIALSEELKSTITPHEYKQICDKENGILPEIKSETNQYPRDKLDQKPSLMTNIKDSNLMKSSLIEQLKNDSINQTTKSYPTEKSAVMSDEMSGICQKEMEREL